MNPKKVEALITFGVTALQSDPVRKALFGTYADGTIRSYTDARAGEFISPKDRARMARKAHKRKNKHKNKDFKQTKKTLDELLELMNEEYSN